MSCNPRERVDENIGWQNSVASNIGKQRLEEIIKLRDYLESQDSNLLDLGCDF